MSGFLNPDITPWTGYRLLPMSFSDSVFLPNVSIGKSTRIVCIQIFSQLLD